MSLREVVRRQTQTGDQAAPLALAICGSPREHGNTVTILDAMLAELRLRGWRTAGIGLGQADVNPCRGCNACRTGPCPQADDMGAIIDAMFAARLVIIGSPVYWGDVTGQLKVVIDRSLPICDSRVGRLALAGRLGVAVVVRAGRRPMESIKTIETIEHYFGHLGIDPAGRIHGEQLEEVDDITQQPEVILAARQLVADLARAVPQSG
jgi:multimeric flavodoxin WrbA